MAMAMSGQLHGPAALPPGRAPGTHWIGGWVGLEQFWTRWWREKFPAFAGNRTIEPRSSITKFCKAISTKEKTLKLST